MSPLTEIAQPISLEQARHVAMMKLLRILRKQFPELKNSDDHFLAVVAAAGMASRGLLPTSLKHNALAKFIKQYADKIGAQNARLDPTAFAEASIESLQTCRTPEFESFIELGNDRLVKALSQFHHSAGLHESLAAGWFRQCSIKSIATNKNVLEGHRTRAGLDDMKQLTQWFTPRWIADFLIEESLTHQTDAVFLDPACGAGHLLVPAMQRLLGQRKKKKRLTVDAALSEILAKQLFGLDVDQRLVGLSKLALYLEARDLADIVELPAANVFSFDGSAEAQAIGSLQLASSSTPLLQSGSLKNQFLPEQFDAIAMNPPYLGHRIMPAMIRDFLRREFPDSQYDLYAAFLELGLRLLKPEGRLAAICQQSVLTIQRYELLRQTIIQTADIESVAQLGSGSFATKGGEKTNTAIISLRKRKAVKPSRNNKQNTQDMQNINDEQSTKEEQVTKVQRNAQEGNGCEESDVRCWQLLTRKDKTIAETAGIKQLPCTTISRIDANNLARALPQSPFSFWAPQEILRLFSSTAPIVDAANGITCTNGLFTCNNKKFVERFDKVTPEKLHEYVPYDKGGGYKWYRTSPLMLHWKADGQEIRDYRIERGQSAKLPGEQHYFKNGVTYSYIGTRGFKARLLTPNSVFDIASSSVFSERIDILFILGFLNSSLVRSLLGILNPTVNFQIGDIRRLPFKTPPAEIEHAVSVLTSQAVEKAKHIETFDPSSPCYLGGINDRYGTNPIESLYTHTKLCEDWTAEESSIQIAIDKIIFDLYEISSSCRNKINEDPWVAGASDAFRKAVFNTI